MYVIIFKFCKIVTKKFYCLSVMFVNIMIIISIYANMRICE
jgi:hypothetical protein